ncbi:glutamate ABC transporter substrate-binding protein [Rhodococcus sp. NPDC058514]|uniref:glutamate ABC transporter substrate-binding protein n=1 Tax=unclassified Rhodococcus (in: high G+C Gram-positive bacteria) TaxID=192944 RepID=UPI003668A945
MRLRRPGWRTVGSALLVAVSLFATGCTQTEPGAVADKSGYTEPPLPEGATVAPPPTGPPANEANCGDPTASLRPFPGVPPEPPPPSASLAEIHGRGRLVVGLDTGSNLFSFRDPATGEIEGFDADIARELARDLVGDPNRVEFRILSSADRIPALMNSTVDVVVKTMTITCERREKVNFSTVYFQAQQRVLAVKGSGITGTADLAGRRVCAAEGTTSVGRIQQVQPDATVVTVQNWGDCLVVLQQGQVDAVSTDDSILAGLAAQDPYLEIVGEGLSVEPYGIGINKSDHDLVRVVNGSLERMRQDGTWTRIYDRWLRVLGPSPGPPVPHYLD